MRKMTVGNTAGVLGLALLAFAAVLAVVGELEASRVAQHVRVDG